MKKSGFTKDTKENKGKIILDLCGGSGSWAKPYAENGYDVKLITLPEYDILHTELTHDTITFQNYNRLYQDKITVKCDDVYGVLAAPPCQMFSFARTNAKRKRNLNEGMSTVIGCLRIIWHLNARLKNQYSQTAPLKFWALENPNGHLKYFLGSPKFIFEPYEFGHVHSKETYIWGWFNDPVKTHGKEARTLNKKFDQLNMKEIRSISDITFKSTNRQYLRSITPSGFAQAFYEVNK